MNTCLLYFITILSLAYGAENLSDIPPEPPAPTQTTTHVPVTTTATPQTPNTTISTTTKATTTKITTTTAKTSTTSSTTTSTSTKPTTTTSSTTTTTSSTTTKTPPTTTNTPPSPTPIPNPTMGNWSVIDPKTNKSCILMDAALQVEIPNTKNNKTLKINVPLNATSSGNCSTANQIINLKWDSPIIGNELLKFEFSKVVNESKFELMEINYTMSVGKNLTTLHHRRAEFVTPLENSYRCNKIQTFNLTDDQNVTIAYLHISHLQLQAYRNSTSQIFDSAKDCDNSLTPDVVPIVVGCVLAVLVVAVLVAYLIGRRRCQARGYLSMFTETEKDSHDEEDLIPMKTLSCFK